MSSPNEHQIAVLAYKYWIERGCPLDSPEVDWYRAVDTLNVRDLQLSAFQLGPDTSAPGPMPHGQQASGGASDRGVTERSLQCPDGQRRNIMSTFIVSIFSNEAKAYEAVHALNELHAEGSISLYDTTVVQRQSGGGLETKKKASSGAATTGLG